MRFDPPDRAHRRRAHVQRSVLAFARERVAPKVAEMDARRRSIAALLPGLFELGVMGIEMPAELRRRGLAASSTRSWRSRRWRIVDPSCRCWSTCRTRSSTTRSCAGAPTSRSSATCRKLASEWVGSYALSEAGSGSDAFALKTRAERRGDRFVLNGPKALDHQRRRELAVHRVRQRRPGAGLQGHHRVSRRARVSPASASARRKTSSASAPRAPCELILEDCEVPDENVLGEVGRGYKIAIETLNEGRIGIGAQMLGTARRARSTTRMGYMQRAQAVRQADRRVSGRAVSVRARGDGDRSRAAHGLQRRAARRTRVQPS